MKHEDTIIEFILNKVYRGDYVLSKSHITLPNLYVIEIRIPKKGWFNKHKTIEILVDRHDIQYPSIQYPYGYGGVYIYHPKVIEIWKIVDRNNDIDKKVNYENKVLAIVEELKCQ